MPIRRLALVLVLLAGLGRARAAFVNWESPPVHPVDLTPIGGMLLVVNTADDRLELFDPSGGLPVWIGSIPVGLDPVSVRARSNTEAWVVNRVSDSVSIVNLTTRNVVATLFPGDEPADVVFAGSPQRAFVTVAQQNHVNVYDPTSLATPPTVVPIQGKDPRALATDGTRVYVAIFESGNRSMILPQSIVSNPAGPYGGVNPPPNSGATFNPPIAPGLPPPPPTSLIVNKEGANWKDDNNHVWDAFVGWNLHENDVAVIKTSDLSLTYAKNLLNIDMAIAVNPATGKVSVVGSYGPNEHRFEVNARNQFSRWRIGSFDPTNIPAAIPVIDMNQQLLANPPQQPYKTSVTAAEHHACVSDPRGLVWMPDGSGAYAAGMGSNNVVKLAENATRLATIDVGQGPTGLALDVPRHRLYVLNRFEGTVSTIDTTANVELGKTGFFDPTPAVVKAGRPFLYDSHLTSKLGNVACTGCHIDATMDTEAWDLGNPAGAMKALDEPCNQGMPFSGTCNDWHPMKGPMMTQSLIGAVGTEPLHWRGDRENIAAFTAAFVGFLDAPAPTPPEMTALEAFLATIRFQPNPFRTIDDQLPASVPGFAGNPQNGATLFATAALDAAGSTCATCHSGPTGAAATIISPNVIQESQGMNVAQLAGIYKKTGLDFTSLANSRGFGFAHDGSADSIFGFLTRSQFTFPAGAAGDQQRRDLEAFVMAFPTDTHPAVGVQLTVDGGNKNAPATVARLAQLTALADAGVVGLVAKGLAGGVARGWAYVAGTQTLQSDLPLETPTADALRQGATSGGEITFTVVPAGTETRIGIDRDGDGWYDRDEIVQGTDPADPASHPTGGNGDADGDGVPDATDDCPTVADPSQADADADGVGDACDPCTNPSHLVMTKPHLRLGKLLPPAGDDTLTLNGAFVVPASPAIDPVTKGLRILVRSAAGSAVLDVTLPGSGWIANASATAWNYSAAAPGVTRASLRRVAKPAGTVKVTARGKGFGFVVSPASLPLALTVVVDTPLAASGQCGEAPFAGPPPAPHCTLNAAQSTVTCK